MPDYQPGDNIFGLDASPDDATVHLLPVPFDATTSYAQGAADGPAAILRASAQLDLHDTRYGRVDRAGIYLHDEPANVGNINETARKLSASVVALGEKGHADRRQLAEINAAGAWVGEAVHQWTAEVLDRGQIAGVIGGEHAVSFGSIRAAAERFPGLGVLQLDAHMDLREAYLGMEWSHASIMRNILERIPDVATLVQVAIRDYSTEELDYARAQGERIMTHLDYDWYKRRGLGASLGELTTRAIEPLPQHVYVSFDIDALSPDLCPSTGTPVPGGLGFNDAALILETLARSGRTIVAFDLVEVAPGPVGELDANIGSGIL